MKTLFLLSSLIFLAHPLVRVKAFLPRISVGGGKSTSFDHALITKRGFLKPLIYFFRDNPQYLKEQHLTSFLLDILSSDSPDALEETVDNITPQIKFLNALSTILSANAEVDSFPLSRSASAHFDGEQFRQGNARLIQLRQELITSLLQGDKLQHARNLAGTALHTLQDFYSHSNWIELGNPGPYRVLGKPGSEIPLEYIAGPTEATCENCERGNCESNLITLKLTSGYRSGQDVKKPENLGKCSHGGTLDESRLKPATGGINKNTATAVESPHASLHNIAADLAAEATSIFLSDIRSTVGDDIFAKFLNLKSENSMALVIDVSGSMSDEISEVKSLSINFVQKTLEKKGSSFTYILVPFSDPEVGPVTVTSDAKTVIEAVNNLTASGGGDCPELGMTGLYQALLHCLPETNIYYFSDADVKDEDRENEVLSLAKKKKVKINFILSGQCGRRKRRNVKQSESFKEFRRIRRSAQGQALYQSVASQTGGQVFQATKSEVADLVEIIDPGSPVNSSVDLQEVGLLNIEESRAQYFSGQSYFVDIDSTLQSLVLVLTAAGSPSLDIQTVEGIGDWFRPSVGIRQGCLLLPTLFRIFLERIMTDALKNHQGTVSIGGRAIANLTFAEDIDGLAGKEEELASQVGLLDKISAAFCMEIAAEKTKLINNNPNGNNIDIRINGEKFDEVDSIKYLGAVVTDQGFKPEVTSRIVHTTAG